jgi:uncharacterized protein YaiI (UPF0178 family)
MPHKEVQKAPPPRLLVDADACPVIDEIINLARKWRIMVYLISNISHVFHPGKCVRIITVDNSPEAADLALMNFSQTGDVAITQDYGLACMLLGKKVKVISPRGKFFTEKNIDNLMEHRHITRKERRRGRLKHGGPPPYTEKDKIKLLKNLEKLLSPQQQESENDKRD